MKEGLKKLAKESLTNSLTGKLKYFYLEYLLAF